MKSLIIGSVGLAVLATTLPAQKSTITPLDHTNVEGYSYQTYYHLTLGVCRIQYSYESWNLGLPSGAKIVAFGYRQDGNLASSALKIQFEAFMGHNTRAQEQLTSTFDKNYESPATNVIAKKIFDLPALSKGSVPSTNFVMLKLDKPFSYISPKNLVTEVKVYNNSNSNKNTPYYTDYARYYAPTATFGQGCLTSGKTFPKLTSGAAIIGSNWSQSMSSFPGSAATILFIGASKTKLLGVLPLPFSLNGLGMTGCNQLVDMNVILVGPATNTGGSASLNLKVPLDFKLVGQKIFTQAWTTDIFANKAGLVVSNGAEAQFGGYPRQHMLYASGSATKTTGSRATNYGTVTRFDYQ